MIRNRTALTFALVVALVLPGVAKAAAYEQVGVFAGSATPLTKEQIEANEEIQLAGVSGMAVNYTGAGGVPKGTLYAVTRAAEMTVAMYVPKAGGGLQFAGRWAVRVSEGPYERCGPLLEPALKCKAIAEASPVELDVDVNQSTGNVYALNNVGIAGSKMVVEYDAEGTEVITRFGERAAAGKTTAETPTQIHESRAGGLAINGAGEVYVFDKTVGPEYHRLMVFEPKTPGDTSEYVYAGDVAAGFNADGRIPARPVIDAAGNVYVAGEEHIDMYAPEAPRPYPAGPGSVACHFEKKGVTAMTVNPLTGEPFFYLYTRELKVKWVRQLGPCEGGTFKETGKAQVIPERSEIYGLAVDPTGRFQPSRPQGILYAGAPSAEPDVLGTGEPGQSSLGYVFAPPQGAAKTLTVAKAGSGAGTVTSEPAGISCGATCAAEFPEGEAVTLSAKADEGSTFAGWSGSGCSGTSTCKVTMSAAKEVTAEFNAAAKPKFALEVEKAGSGTGTVTSTPVGIDCGPDCEEEYEEGTAVTLSGTPGVDTKAVAWSGCDSVDGENKCLVSISAAREVTATFEEEEKAEVFPVAVAVEGTGTGTVTSDKGTIACNPFCSDEYEAGTKVTLTATPAPGSLFYSWRYCDAGGVNGRQCTVSVDKAKTVKATFTTTHALKVSRTGTGLGKVQSSPGGVLCLFNCQDTTAAFREGTEVTLKPTPAKHFHFVEWLGDCSGSGACVVTMGEDHEVSAEFAEDTKHPLTLTKSGGGAGTVKSSVAGINCGATCSSTQAAYYQGEVIELTATPGKGSAFKGWSGACPGSGTCTVTMGEAREVTAEFG